jgi:FemAB-related protein (PEP-CTERM system-associated)
MGDGTDTANTIPCQVESSHTTPDWEDFLQRHPEVTIYHSPRWGAVMQQAYGNLPIYLTARRNQQITGILQLVAQKSLLFGSHLCSLPYFDASGIQTDDEESANALIDQARRLLNTHRVQWIELRHLQPVGPSLPTRSDKVTLSLALPPDEEELWRRLKPKVRNQIRKAQKENMQVLQAGADLLPEFYDVYLRNMRDLGSPPHSRRFFRLILESFSEQAKIFVIRLDSQPMAAGFSLMDRNTLRVPWAGSNWKYRSLNPNMLLYWSMLADACQKNADFFDFGRSTLDSGTYKFKKQWGASEIPLHWQFLLPDGNSLPELTPDSPRYRFFVSCWKKLPLWAAQWLGPKIIAKLS